MASDPIAPAIDPDLITLAEAAQFSGYSTDHLRHMAQDGKLGAVKVAPRLWMVRRSAVGALERDPRGRPKTQPS